MGFGGFWYILPKNAAGVHIRFILYDVADFSGKCYNKSEFV